MPEFIDEWGTGRTYWNIPVIPDDAICPLCLHTYKEWLDGSMGLCRTQRYRQSANLGKSIPIGQRCECRCPKWVK